MPIYTTTLLEARAVAGEIARSHSAVFQCVNCAHAICIAIGPRPDAFAVKVVTAEGRGIVTYPERGLQISTTGQHVGIRIGGVVFDNLHPEGVTANNWPGLFRDRGYQPLVYFERPLDHFFGKIFRWREFAQFTSNRFQADEFEWDFGGQQP